MLGIEYGKALTFTFILSNPCYGDAAKLWVAEAKQKRATWTPHQPLLRQLLAYKAMNQPAP